MASNNVTVFRGGQQSSYALNRRIVALRKLAPSAAPAAPVNAVAASLATALGGANNDLDFTAKLKGAAGNNITIAYIDPPGNNVALSVAVTGTDIVVTLATDGSSAITSTAAQVKAAIEASAAAAALVSVAHHVGNDGSGVVTALAEAPLANGVDGTLGDPWEQRYYGGYVYLNASDAKATVSTANWKKFQLTTA